MYRVVFTRQAEKDLLSIEKALAGRIADKISHLSEHMERLIPEPLSGKFKGKYKLRAGDWRVVYETNHTEKTITIYAIEHRSKVYK